MNRQTLTRATLSEMTTEQLQLALALARVMLDQPAIAPAPTKIAEPRATCPHCGESGKVAELFGYRVVRGTSYPQSWCRTCRSKPAKASKKR